NNGVSSVLAGHGDQRHLAFEIDVEKERFFALAEVFFQSEEAEVARAWPDAVDGRQEILSIGRSERTDRDRASVAQGLDSRVVSDTRHPNSQRRCQAWVNGISAGLAER